MRADINVSVSLAADAIGRVPKTQSIRRIHQTNAVLPDMQQYLVASNIAKCNFVPLSLYLVYLRLVLLSLFCLYYIVSISAIQQKFNALIS